MQQPQHLYDRATTVFSPNGRIYQVEYAREVVKRGSTVVGVTANDGVGFLSGRRESSRLAIQDSVEKIFKIDDHMGTASCGLVADARTLVDMARHISTNNTFRYDEPIDVSSLARQVSTRIHGYTQTGGARPFGVSMLLGGFTGGEANLYETDPSGAFIGYKAGALGSRRQEVMNELEDRFEPNQPVEDALAAGYASMTQAEGEDPVDEIEGAIIDEDGFRRLSPEEIEEIAGDASTSA